MANSVTTQLILDGPRNCVVKFEGILDTSDLGSTVVLNPALLVGMDNTGTQKAAKLRITDINYAIEDGLAINLFWDATTPERIESLTGRGEREYEDFGGLVNNAGAGVTGIISATSQGWAAAGILSFSLIIQCTKQQ